MTGVDLLRISYLVTFCDEDHELTFEYLVFTTFALHDSHTARRTLSTFRRAESDRTIGFVLFLATLNLIRETEAIFDRTFP